MKQILFLAGLASAVFLGVYGVITVYDDQLRAGRMWETPVVRPHESPLLVMEEGLVPQGGGEARLQATPPETLLPPEGFVSPDMITLGKKAYGSYCIHCHGKYLDGLGTVGQSFFPPLRDLRDPRVQKKSNGLLFHEIGYGIKDIPRMPALATTVSVADRWAVIRYIRSEAIKP